MRKYLVGYQYHVIQGAFAWASAEIESAEPIRGVEQLKSLLEEKVGKFHKMATPMLFQKFED